MLDQRSGLTVVLEIARERLDTVREFMSDDIQRLSEPPEKTAISITVTPSVFLSRSIIHRHILSCDIDLGATCTEDTNIIPLLSREFL